MKAGSAYVQHEAERLGIVPPAPDQHLLVAAAGYPCREPVSPERRLQANGAFRGVHLLARFLLRMCDRAWQSRLLAAMSDGTSRSYVQ
jgi:hypothetical protein